MQAAERARSGANLDSSLDEFNQALRAIIQVPKAELDSMLATERTQNAHKPKRGPKPKERRQASGHAVCGTANTEGDYAC